jgi:pimeloyl-ACP methyl ester carboxylesterase
VYLQSLARRSRGGARKVMIWSMETGESPETHLLMTASDVLGLLAVWGLLRRSCSTWQWLLVWTGSGCMVARWYGLEMGDSSGRMAARCSAGSMEALSCLHGGDPFCCGTWMDRGCVRRGRGIQASYYMFQIETYVPLISPHYVSDTG